VTSSADDTPIAEFRWTCCEFPLTFGHADNCPGSSHEATTSAGTDENGLSGTFPVTTHDDGRITVEVVLPSPVNFIPITTTLTDEPGD